MFETLLNARRLTVVLPAITVILLLLPNSLSAQSSRTAGNQFELTPSAGFQFGGSYEFDDPEYGFTEYGVKSSESWGLTFGIPVGRQFQIELMYLLQDTELEIERGVGVLLDDQAKFEFYHVGFLWQGNQGQIRPFFVVSAGATQIDPGLTQFSAQTEPSASIGGGAKIMFSQNLGLRFEARLLATSLDDNYDYYDDRCCRNRDRYDETIVQGRGSVGLIFAF